MKIKSLSTLEQFKNVQMCCDKNFVLFKLDIFDEQQIILHNLKCFIVFNI